MKLFPIRHFPDGFTWWLKIWRYSSALIIPFFSWQHSQHRWLKYSSRPWESFRRVLNLLHITVPHFIAFSSIILCAEAVSQPVLRWHGPIYLNCNELRLLIPQSLTSLCEHKKSMKTYKSNQYCSIRNFLLKISQRWKWIIACSKTRVVKKNRLNHVFLPLKTARTESFVCWKRPLLSRRDWLRCAMTLERFFFNSAQHEM